MTEVTARVNGAVSLVNAIAIGKGSTLGIDRLGTAQRFIITS